MRGELLVTLYDEDDNAINSIEGTNMVCVGGAEILVDGLTISPSLSGIESASAILDTSNYTIHGISFGKGYDGYDSYAHDSSLSSSWSVIDATYVNTANVVSGFNSTAVESVLIPTFPHPDDRRLQAASTKAPISLAATENVGHNMNAIEFSATNGCYWN